MNDTARMMPPPLRYGNPKKETRELPNPKILQPLLHGVSLTNQQGTGYHKSRHGSPIPQTGPVRHQHARNIPVKKS